MDAREMTLHNDAQYDDRNIMLNTKDTDTSDTYHLPANVTLCTQHYIIIIFVDFSAVIYSIKGCSS